MSERSQPQYASVTGDQLLPPVVESVAHLLFDAARKSPDSEALVCRDRRLTYAQYADLTLKLARWLRQRALPDSGSRCCLEIRSRWQSRASLFML